MFTNSDSLFTIFKLKMKNAKIFSHKIFIHQSAKTNTIEQKERYITDSKKILHQKISGRKKTWLLSKVVGKVKGWSLDADVVLALNAEDAFHGGGRGLTGRSGDGDGLRNDGSDDWGRDVSEVWRRWGCCLRVEDADGAGLLGGGGRCGGGGATAGQRAGDGFLGKKKIILLLYFLNAMSGLYQETLQN